MVATHLICHSVTNYMSKQINQKTKIINYRGGIVTFSIPVNWREEYEALGGATFYEDHSDSGTLRLNVLTFESDDTPAQQMSLNAFPVDSFQLLPTGFPILYAVNEAMEDEDRLHIHIWKVAVPILPHCLRIVVFQHTILASQESDPLIMSELALLRQSIHSAHFSKQQASRAATLHEYCHPPINSRVKDSGW